MNLLKNQRLYKLTTLFSAVLFVSSSQANYEKTQICSKTKTNRCIGVFTTQDSTKKFLKNFSPTSDVTNLNIWKRDFETQFPAVYKALGVSEMTLEEKVKAFRILKKDPSKIDDVFNTLKKELESTIPAFIDSYPKLKTENIQIFIAPSLQKTHASVFTTAEGFQKAVSEVNSDKKVFNIFFAPDKIYVNQYEKNRDYNWKHLVYRELIQVTNFSISNVSGFWAKQNKLARSLWSEGVASVGAKQGSGSQSFLASQNAKLNKACKRKFVIWKSDLINDLPKITIPILTNNSSEKAYKKWFGEGSEEAFGFNSVGYCMSYVTVAYLTDKVGFDKIISMESGQALPLFKKALKEIRQEQVDAVFN